MTKTSYTGNCDLSTHQTWIGVFHSFTRTSAPLTRVCEFSGFFLLCLEEEGAAPLRAFLQFLMPGEGQNGILALGGSPRTARGCLSRQEATQYCTISVPMPPPALSGTRFSSEGEIDCKRSCLASEHRARNVLPQSTSVPNLTPAAHKSRWLKF